MSLYFVTEILDIFHNTNFFASNFLMLYFLLFVIHIWKLEINPYLILLVLLHSRHLIYSLQCEGSKTGLIFRYQSLALTEEKQCLAHHFSNLFSQMGVHRGSLGTCMNNYPFLIHLSTSLMTQSHGKVVQISGN